MTNLTPVLVSQPYSPIVRLQLGAARNLDLQSYGEDEPQICRDMKNKRNENSNGARSFWREDEM